MHYKKQWFIVGIIYIGLILVGSLINIPEGNFEKIEHNDKIIHFIMYFILVGWFVQLYQKPATRTLILTSAIILGMIIEYLQGMTPYRSFDLLDEIANSLGACCAYLLARTSFASVLHKIDLRLHHLLNG